MVLQDCNKPHRNDGELMSAGVSCLLAELGDIDDRDIFLDIGGGIGSVEAPVVMGLVSIMQLVLSCVPTFTKQG